MTYSLMQPFQYVGYKPVAKSNDGNVSDLGIFLVCVCLGFTVGQVVLFLLVAK